jgi:hypothetical protein
MNESASIDDILIEQGSVLTPSLLSGALSLLRPQQGANMGFGFIGAVMRRGDPLGGKINVSRFGLSPAHQQFVMLASRVTHDEYVITLAMLEHFGLANPSQAQVNEVRGLVRKALYGCP